MRGAEADTASGSRSSPRTTVAVIAAGTAPACVTRRSGLQINLFPEPTIRPSGPCQACGGRMENDGPVKETATCRTVRIRCAVCNSTAVESDNLTLKE